MRRSSRTGSALILALIVVTSVAILSVGMLRMMGAMTSRQEAATDDRQAFYLAEAGLSEAFASLTTGGNGNVGSLERPVMFGGGLVFVEVLEPEEGDDPDIVTLRSTGMHARGRSTLEVVLRRVEKPFGIFADEEISFDQPFLLDGYDSDTSEYFEQAGLPKLVGEAGVEYKWAPEEKLLYYEGWWYKYERHEEPRTFYWLYRYQDSNVSRITDQGLVSDADDLLAADSGDVVTDLEYGVPTEGSAYEYHTDVGGALGSNGDVTLYEGAGEVEIYGDVVPGPEGTVTLGAGVSISGETTPRTERLELTPVDVPGVTMLPGFEHTGALPRVLPAADVGYDFITVGPDAEVVIQGPGNLVMNDLLLEDGSKLTVDNLFGAVNMYVTNSAVLSAGSLVEVLNTDPAELSLQIAGDVGPITLDATTNFYGMVYGPEAEISIGQEFEIFGALAGRRLQLAPFAKLHFDSGVLGDSGAVPMPKFVGWKIEQVPAAVAHRDRDPFAMLELDKTELVTLGEEEKQADSWTIKVKYWNNADFAIYEGPIEDVEMPPWAENFYVLELTEPKDGGTDWPGYVRYVCNHGVVREHDDPITVSGLIGLTGASLLAWEVVNGDQGDQGNQDQQ